MAGAGLLCYSYSLLKLNPPRVHSGQFTQVIESYSRCFQDELDLPLQRRQAMYSMSPEKKWQLYLSKKKVSIQLVIVTCPKPIRHPIYDLSRSKTIHSLPRVGRTTTSID